MGGPREGGGGSVPSRGTNCSGKSENQTDGLRNRLDNIFIYEISTKSWRRAACLEALRAWH